MHRIKAMTDPKNTNVSADVTDGIYFAVPRQILASEEIDWSFPSDQQVIQQAERDQHPYVPSNASSDRPRLMDHFDPDVDEYLLRCSLDKFESQTVSSFRNNIITKLSATLQDISLSKNSDGNDGSSSSGDEDANHQSDQNDDKKETNMKKTDVKLSSVYKNNLSYNMQGLIFQTNLETDLTQGCFTTGLTKEGDLEESSSDCNLDLKIENDVSMLTNDKKTQSTDFHLVDTLMVDRNGSLMTDSCQKNDQISTSPSLKDSFTKENHITSQGSEKTIDSENVDAFSDTAQTHKKVDRRIGEPVMNNQVQTDDPFFTETLRRNLRLEDDNFPIENSSKKKDIDAGSTHPWRITAGHNGAISSYNIGLANDSSFTLSLRRNLLLEDEEYPADDQTTIIPKAKNDIRIEGHSSDENHIRENLNVEQVNTENAESEHENSRADSKESVIETNDTDPKFFLEKEPGMMHRNSISKQSLFLHSMINDTNDSSIQLTVSSNGITTRKMVSVPKVCEVTSFSGVEGKIINHNEGKEAICGEIGKEPFMSQVDVSNNEQNDLEEERRGTRSELVTRDDCVRDCELEDLEGVNNFKSKNIKQTFVGSHVHEVSEDGKNSTADLSVVGENKVCLPEKDDSSSQSFVPKCLPRTSKSLKTLGSNQSSSDLSSVIDDSTFKILEVQKYFREKTAKFSVSDVILETPEEYADPTPEPIDPPLGVNEIESNLVSNHFALTPTPSPRNIPEDVMIISVSDEDSNETVETRVVIKNPSADRFSPVFSKSSERRYVLPAIMSPRTTGFNPSISPDPADWAKHLTVSKGDQQLSDCPSPSRESSSSNLWLSCSEEDRQVNLLNYDVFRTDFSDADPDLNSAWPFTITNDQPKECPNVFYSECYALHL